MEIAAAHKLTFRLQRESMGERQKGAPSTANSKRQLSNSRQTICFNTRSCLPVMLSDICRFCLAAKVFIFGSRRFQINVRWLMQAFFVSITESLDSQLLSICVIAVQKSKRTRETLSGVVTNSQWTTSETFVARVETFAASYRRKCVKQSLSQMMWNCKWHLFSMFHVHCLTNR